MLPVHYHGSVDVRLPVSLFPQCHPLYCIAGGCGRTIGRRAAGSMKAKRRKRNKQNKTRQNKTKQDKTRQNKTKQNKPKQNKTEQNKAKQKRNARERQHGIAANKQKSPENTIQVRGTCLIPVYRRGVVVPGCFTVSIGVLAHPLD